MYLYTKSNGGFVLEDTESGKVVSQFETLGIVYSTEEYDNKLSFVLLKHGDIKWTRKYYEKYKEQYDAIKIPLDIMEVDKCLLEDLNHIIECSALPLSHLERIKPLDISCK